MHTYFCSYMFTYNTHTLVYWCICIIYAFYDIRARTHNHLNPLSVTHTHTHKHTHDIPIGEFHASHPILQVIFIKAHELKPALRPVPANMYMYTLYM